MFNLCRYVILSFILTGLFTNTTFATKAKMVQQNSYREAQREFSKKNYPAALKLFEKFVFDNKDSKDKYIKTRVLWSVDIVARIHLKVNKDVDKASAFLNKIIKMKNLNDAEFDSIQEWISVANEWKKLGKRPKDIKTKDELFTLGKKYFEKGLNDKLASKSSLSNPNLYIAAMYLVPYVYNYDDSKHIDEALLMLGSIRLRSWNDYDYWTENFYLKEVIRRFPHTKIARKAYDLLEEGIRMGYTGSAGESTPPSQVEMLKTYKKLAAPAVFKKPSLN